MDYDARRRSDGSSCQGLGCQGLGRAQSGVGCNNLGAGVPTERDARSRMRQLAALGSVPPETRVRPRIWTHPAILPPQKAVTRRPDNGWHCRAVRPRHRRSDEPDGGQDDRFVLNGSTNADCVTAFDALLSCLIWADN
jgi:hypothetical protein